MQFQSKTIEYKNKKVELSMVKDNVIEATVDNKKIHLDFNSEKQKFSSQLMPYQDYDDPEKLVKDVLDHHPDFKEANQ